MREIVFRELKKRCREIRSNSDKDQVEKGMRSLVNTVKSLYNLSLAARREGLLSLEEKVDDFDEPGEWKDLKKMIMMVIDGLEPEEIAEISMARYAVKGLKGIKGLQYLLQLEGALAIRKGLHPKALEDKLLAYVPEAVEEIYRESEKESGMNRQDEPDEAGEPEKTDTENEAEGNSEADEAARMEEYQKELDSVLRQLAEKAYNAMYGSDHSPEEENNNSEEGGK